MQRYEELKGIEKEEADREIRRLVLRKQWPFNVKNLIKFIVRTGF